MSVRQQYPEVAQQPGGRVDLEAAVPLGVGDVEAVVNQTVAQGEDRVTTHLEADRQLILGEVHLPPGGRDLLQLPAEDSLSRNPCRKVFRVYNSKSFKYFARGTKRSNRLSIILRQIDWDQI